MASAGSCNNRPSLNDSGSQFPSIAHRGPFGAACLVKYPVLTLIGQCLQSERERISGYGLRAALDRPMGSSRSPGIFGPGVARVPGAKFAPYFLITILPETPQV